MSRVASGHDPSIYVYKLKGLARGRSGPHGANSSDATTSDATIMLGRGTNTKDVTKKPEHASGPACCRLSVYWATMNQRMTAMVI